MHCALLAVARTATHGFGRNALRLYTVAQAVICAASLDVA
jgi:hypothetical protein